MDVGRVPLRGGTLDVAIGSPKSIYANENARFEKRRHSGYQYLRGAGCRRG